jgi:uncharacterized repeat protein (TIGR01451 family)
MSKRLEQRLCHGYRLSGLLALAACVITACQAPLAIPNSERITQMPTEGAVPNDPPAKASDNVQPKRSVAPVAHLAQLDQPVDVRPEDVSPPAEEVHGPDAASKFDHLPQAACPLPHDACPNCGPVGPWRPSGLSGPWPRDEYLCDGGDFILPAKIRGDFSVEGVEPEDTIAHYDTLSGERVVAPSNKVCIYAPRFGVVRRVDNLFAHEVHDRVAGFEYPMKPNLHLDNQLATTAIQPIEPLGQVGSKNPTIYRERQQGGGLENQQAPIGFHDGLMPYEDFQVIHNGVFDQAEKARLAIRVQAAYAWAGDQAVQVILDGKLANELVGDKQPEAVYRFDRPKSPELRICKVASRHAAQLGDIVEFTLRFDNTGDQTVGNVTIIDNLTTRLVYVADTSQCTLPHEFVPQVNQAGSMALRWEITNPLEPGQGGVIRFKCRVR